MKERLNITKSLVNKEIKDNWSLKELVNFIKNPPNTHITKVKASRELFKVCKDSYESVKLSFPCFIPNFTFKNKYVKGSNLDSPTGYLYIDIDDNTSIDLNSPYIVAYWKSLSNEGYTVIVSAEGLTNKNYKESTKYVSNLLDLPLDSCAISIDRNVVISYDKDAFYTDSYKTIDLTSIVTEKGKVSKPLLTLERGKRVKSEFDSSVEYKLKTNTLEDIIKNIDFKDELMYDLGSKVGYATVGARHLKIPVGKRNSSLFFMCCQIKAMNTWAEVGNMLPYMKTINKDGTQEPVSDSELIKICNNVIKRYNRGDLELINNKTRRFLFNPKYHLTKEQKFSMIMTYLNLERRTVNYNKIMEYVNKSGETNRTKVSKAVGLSRQTVSDHLNMERVKVFVETENTIDSEVISEKCNIKVSKVNKYLEEFGY